MNEIETRVREFIHSNFVLGDTSSLGAEDSLMDAGVIDSTGVLELTSFLEESFEIVIEDADLVPENLDTIGRIVAFVQRKTAGVEGSQ